jgi:1-phosphofructokinase family hexose kinase
MILCVTLNPCLDKTLTVPPWKPGDNIRGRSLREVVGGKGNNVARALTRLGRASRPVTFLGGSVGDRCETLFREVEGFDPLVTRTAAATREILTVRAEGSEPTAFFDPDPAITAEEADHLLGQVRDAVAAGGIEALTLSGSSPSLATHGLYSELIAVAKAKKVPTFLDTYGPALESIWGFWPDAIQLNRREAGLHLRDPQPSDAALLRLLETWSRKGVKIGIVTDGADATLARVGSQTYRVQPPEITPVNPIGSGDCHLAGLVDGFLAGLDAHGMLRRATAAAVANALVWDAGGIEAREVGRLEKLVEIAVN